MEDRATMSERMAWYHEAKAPESDDDCEEFESLREDLLPELETGRGRRHYAPRDGANPSRPRGGLRHGDPMSAEEALLAIEFLLNLSNWSDTDSDTELAARELSAKLELKRRATATLRAVLDMPKRLTREPDPKAEVAEFLLWIQWKRLVIRSRRARARSRRAAVPESREGGDLGAGPAGIVAPAVDPVVVVQTEPVSA